MTRLIFFGSSALSVQVLEHLLTTPDIEVVAVVTKAPAEHGHSHSHDTPVARMALDHSIPLLRPLHADEIITDLKQFGAEVGVLFAYGQILSDSLRAVFPRGIVNIHPSLLPLYRGPSPIEAALLAGDTTVGTSIMVLESGMDTGPLLSQKSLVISPTISKSDLTSLLMQASLTLLVPTLQEYLAAKIQPRPQDDTKASICRLIHKSDGEITLDSESIETFDRKVRAYAGWPTVSLPVLHHETPIRLQIHAGHILNRDAHTTPDLRVTNKTLVIELKDGTYAIDQAQLPGRKIVSGRDLANSPSLGLRANF